MPPTTQSPTEPKSYKSVRVEEDIYDEIRRYAELEDRSISAIVRRAMKAYAKQTKR